MQEHFLTTVTLKVTRGEWRVWRCVDENDEKIDVQIVDPANDIVPGLTYRFVGGDIQEHEIYGKQVKADSFTVITPAGEEAIKKYISKCSGIGPKTAKAIWNLYKEDSVRILRESPEKVSKDLEQFPNVHLSTEKATQASELLKSQQALESCTIELESLLHGRGFPKATVMRIIKRFDVPFKLFNSFCQMRNLRNHILLMQDYPD